MSLSEGLARLRAIRGGHRAVLTKYFNELQELLATTELSEESLTRIEVLKQQLDGKQKTLTELDAKILNEIKIEDVEKEIEESEAIVIKVTVLKERIERVRKQNATSQHTIVENSQNRNEQGAVAMATPSSSFTRLPKLQLPHFKGDVTKWNSFWDSFDSAIHSNEALSKIDKYNYLNSLLEGPAARAVQGLTLTEANYDTAIELLKSRFGKTQQVISAHMDELLHLPNCGTDKPSSLRFVFDKVRIHVRGLEALGVSSKEYGSLLIPIVMNKLPNDLRMRVARETSGDVWKIDEILEILRKEIEATEASERFKVAERQKHYESLPRKPLPTMGNTLLSQEKEFKIRCVYCDAPHYSASCPTVTDLAKRREALVNGKRCFKCLRQGHEVRDCRNPKLCRNCGGHHHQSICSKGFLLRNVPKKEEQRKEEQRNDEKNKDKSDGAGNVGSQGSTLTVGNLSTSKRHVLLQTARAVATNEDGSKTCPVCILFDNGSQRSYITDDLKRKLNLNPIKVETLYLNTFGDSKHERKSCQLFNLNLCDRDNELTPICALNFPVICSPLPSTVDIFDYPHIRGLDLADCSEGQDEHHCNTIDVLIGSDCYWNFIYGETIRGDSGPVAVSSKFGWVLSGQSELTNAKGVRQEESLTSLVISSRTKDFLGDSVPQNDQLVDSLRRFWETETIGIADGDDRTASPVPNDFIEDIAFDGQNYQVGLPWKGSSFPVSNGYDTCSRRLQSLHRKLQADPVLLNEYHKIICDQLEADIIERVPEPPDASSEETCINFLPHHPVIRRDKDTTKVRVVYDGSAKGSNDGRSLNDCLETGPNFTPHVFDILVKFRWNAIGITADIEKAFLMIGIKEVDRDALRFLWFDDPNECHPNLTMFRFRRLVFGLRPSPSILGFTIKHHLEKYSQSEPKLVEVLENSFYVDDLITGEDSVEESVQIYKGSKRIMATGGFNLRKWNSNSDELLAKIESSEFGSEASTDRSLERPNCQTLEEDESYAKSTTGRNTIDTADNTVKVLGSNWNTKTDEIFFNFERWKEEASSLPMTKRSLLVLTAKIFDPLGYLAPLTILMKVCFQVLCTNKVDWDEELTGDLLNKFQAVIQDISLLHSVRIPRCYFYPGSKPVSVELHGFSDASIHAYSAVVYLKSVYGNGKIQVQLVASKTRVSPMKKQTIPRLELLGALILARLCDKIIKVLGQLDCTYWVDSTTALCWIRNDKLWKQYVQHRVNEIRNLSSTSAWRYCPGVDNPADLPSRGLNARELANSEVWWNGPQFLCQPSCEWPSEDQTRECNEDAKSEEVKAPKNITHVLLNQDPMHATARIDKVMNIERYGSFGRLLRVTAIVLRFIKLLRSKISRGSQDNLNEDVKDLNTAEVLWIRAAQMSCFPEEIKLLSDTRKDTIGSRDPKSKIIQFGLYLDEAGILRSRGRLNESSLPLVCKNPIFLPNKHPFVNLLIMHIHNDVKHSGVRDTLTTIRERFLGCTRTRACQEIN